MNVPLMWAAANGDRRYAGVEGRSVAPANVGGEDVPGRVAVTVGWEVFHNANAQLGHPVQRRSTTRVFPRPRWGAHFSGRVQERIWNVVIARVARGAAFESLYVHIVMQACLDDRPIDIVEDQPPREEQARIANGWEVLNDVDGRGCSTVVLVFSTVSSCIQVDVQTGRARVWKLFLSIPLLLRRPAGEWRIGKEELSTRFE